MIEDQRLVDEFLDGFKIWEKFFFVVVSVFHERELTVDFVQLVFEVILKNEFLYGDAWVVNWVFQGGLGVKYLK